MIELADIQRAAGLLEGVAARTPVVCSDFLSRATGATVFLKLENLQTTGSFKLRGAYCRIASARDRIGPKGVVAASAGNHAQGVALAATRLGVPATVVMPETASLSKQTATRGYGAQVILRGSNLSEALLHAQDLATEGYFFVHPFDDPEVIAGQGTIGLEIAADLDGVDEVWLPVGGGGLLAGTAVALKAALPDVRVVGVQASCCAAALAAQAAGTPVELPACRTIADGIAVPRVGDIAFELMGRYADDLVCVEEDEIASAIVYLLERKKVLAEGAGAAPLAALLKADPADVRGRRIALVISGGNLDLSLLDRVLERGLIATGRMLRLRVQLQDTPGSLEDLLHPISGEGANVLRIHHDRLAKGVPLGSAQVEMWVETRGFEHVRRLTEVLRETGFPDAVEKPEEAHTSTPRSSFVEDPG